MPIPPFLLFLAYLASGLLLRAEIMPGQQALAQKLLQVREPEAFEKLRAEATAAGLPQQAILEARFLYLVDLGDRARLAALSDELAACEKKFDIANTLVFSVPEDFSAIVEYTRALRALENKQPAAFKKHITEAFWLSPKQSQIFGQHIEHQRMAELMAALRADLKTTYPKLLPDGENASLGKLMGDSPALLLHFWSPWSPEAESSLPEFRATARELAKQQIPVASILFNNGQAEAHADARLFAQGQAMNIPATWLLDHRANDNALSYQLRVQQLPAFVLLDPRGKVIHNGTSEKDAFWLEIKKLAPDATRPQDFREANSFRVLE